MLQLLRPDDPDRRKRKLQQGRTPDVGDEVLLATRFIPEAANERYAAEERGRKRHQRDADKHREISQMGRDVVDGRWKAGRIGFWLRRLVGKIRADAGAHRPG